MFDLLEEGNNNQYSEESSQSSAPQRWKVFELLQTSDLQRRRNIHNFGQNCEEEFDKNNMWENIYSRGEPGEADPCSHFQGFKEIRQQSQHFGGDDLSFEFVRKLHRIEGEFE